MCHIRFKAAIGRWRIFAANTASNIRKSLTIRPAIIFSDCCYLFLQLSTHILRRDSYVRLNSAFAQTRTLHLTTILISNHDHCMLMFALWLANAHILAFSRRCTAPRCPHSSTVGISSATKRFLIMHRLRWLQFVVSIHLHQAEPFLRGYKMQMRM